MFHTALIGHLRQVVASRTATLPFDTRRTGAAPPTPTVTTLIPNVTYTLFPLRIIPQPSWVQTKKTIDNLVALLMLIVGK